VAKPPKGYGKKSPEYYRKNKVKIGFFHGTTKHSFLNDKKRKMYCKNHIPIIFVETYKGEKKWKGYIVIKLREIQILRQELLSRISELQGYKQEILAAS